MKGFMLLARLAAFLVIQHAGLAQNTRVQFFSFGTGYEILRIGDVQAQSVLGGSIIGLAQGPNYLLSSGFPIRSPGQITSVSPSGPEALPDRFALQQNYPNPFNPTTIIRFQVPKRVHVVLRVYNVVGQEIALLVDEIMDAGSYQIRWNARVSSGVYFYRLRAGEYMETKKMLFTR